eukprot:TRINITY_DN2100_c3_g1_i1.p1 TRINITY_DN2100_c3_g1~~TRINITY_DN2100_c3_g1_i1.p1  ORF type:complete len:338 (+),score=54.62 TRINITY_DN2100_c3_g1_i1:95-1015(+)
MSPAPGHGPRRRSSCLATKKRSSTVPPSASPRAYQRKRRVSFSRDLASSTYEYASAQFVTETPVTSPTGKAPDAAAAPAAPPATQLAAPPPAAPTYYRTVSPPATRRTHLQTPAPPAERSPPCVPSPTVASPGSASTPSPAHAPRAAAAVVAAHPTVADPAVRQAVAAMQESAVHEAVRTAAAAAARSASEPTATSAQFCRTDEHSRRGVAGRSAAHRRHPPPQQPLQCSERTRQELRKLPVASYAHAAQLARELLKASAAAQEHRPFSAMPHWVTTRGCDAAPVVRAGNTYGRPQPPQRVPVPMP